MYNWIKTNYENNSKEFGFALTIGLAMAYFMLVIPKKVMATAIAGILSLLTLSFLQQKKLNKYYHEYGNIDKRK